MSVLTLALARLRTSTTLSTEIGNVITGKQQAHWNYIFLHCTVTGFPKFTFTFTSINYWNIYTVPNKSVHILKIILSKIKQF